MHIKFLSRKLGLMPQFGSFKSWPSRIPKSSIGLLPILVFVQCLHLTVGREERNGPQRVAIIGAGAGGSSAAYHLRTLLGDKVTIDIFEEKNEVGGRLATANIFGNEYEAGGSILHPKNKLALELLKITGLSQFGDRSSKITTLLKDSKFIFSTSSWKLMTIAKILYRYGLDFYHLDNMISAFVEEFGNIYPLQAQGASYENVQALLEAMGPSILNLTRSHFDEYLLSQGYKPEFVSELVSAVLFVNYGQSSKIHSLVGSVSMAGAANGLWSVRGGNKKLPSGLISKSNAQLFLNTQISSLVAQPNGLIQLFKSSMTSGGGQGSEEPLPNLYDKVILAIPIPSNEKVKLDLNNNTNHLGGGSHIKLINFTGEAANPLPPDYLLNSFGGQYQRIISTIVAANSLTPKYKPYGDIITCDPHFFNSVSRIHPVLLTRSEIVPVFKVFSPEPLTETQLGDLFEDIRAIHVSDWFAYPNYNRTPPRLRSFLVHPDIYHLNGIEWAASAIEMSLISGRNAAIHLANSLNEGVRASRKRSRSGQEPSGESSPKKAKSEL